VEARFTWSTVAAATAQVYAETIARRLHGQRGR
jgi:hypothetical protein